MDHRRFDNLAQLLAGGGSRRSVVGLLAGLGLGVAALPDADAAKKNKNKKKGTKRFCLNGQNVKAKNKKKKNRLRRKGAVRGRCQGCTPECPTDGACGTDDGCGGICGCGTGAVCAAGKCETCTVTCTGSATVCGTALQAAITGGGNLYVCPGLYAAPSSNGFLTSPVATNIFGAGNGSDQASDTILDAQGRPTPVVLSPFAGLTLSGLRITGGNNPSGAGGIFSTVAQLLAVDTCAIVDNTGSTGGGVHVMGPLAMTNSLVSGNTGTAPSGIGGIFLNPSTAGIDSTISDTVIDDNEGVAYGGIHILTSDAGQTLTVDSDSQITNNRFTAGSDPRAGGIGKVGPGTADATGATISGNTSPQCLNVTGCSS